MIALNRVRWVQVLIGENHWKDAIFSQLESGDIFRLVEPNGQLAHGGQVYVVREAPQVAVQEWPASAPRRATASASASRTARVRLR